MMPKATSDRNWVLLFSAQAEETRKANKAPSQKQEEQEYARQHDS